MHARVVRFTDVTPERISELSTRIEQEEGNGPPGVDAAGVDLYYDESQGTAVVVIQFDSEEKMREADAAFDQMDPSETPGTRASVDSCELKVQARA